MKLFIYSLSILLLHAACTTAQSGAITPSEFEKRMAESVQLLDVRTAAEYQRGHLKNTVQADWLDKKQFAERTEHLDKEKPILVYCASGVRSGEAMKWLIAKGFTNVANLKGGLSAWKMEGKPLEELLAPAAMEVRSFQEKIQKQKIVLVDVGAEWCPPCKKMEPVLVKLQTNLGSSFSLLKVDGGNDIAVMKLIDATILPTFIIYKNGKQTWRKEGVVSYDDLKLALTQ